ncbi:MAG TPA: asparagine synthase-related protein [Sphingomicrobium sp.]
MFARYALTFGRGAHRHGLRAAAISLGLATIIDRSDLLFVAERGTPSLEASGKILVGQIFSPNGVRLASLDPLLDAAAPDQGATLPDHYWGNFALFESAGGQASVYREPSGSIPVYHCRQNGEDLFVSDADFAARLGLLRDASPDGQFAVHWLQFPFLRTCRSGLDGVTEILPGVRWTQKPSGGWQETAIWRPAAFLARRDAILDPAEAKCRLRETALATIATQVPRAKPLLQLSGGLDSSIIAACLGEAGTDFAAVTFATRSPDGDERDYARDVAKKVGVRLRELLEEDAKSLDPHPSPSFRPPANPLLRSLQAAIASAAAELQCDLIVDGAGGDNLFCSVTSPAPILDALWWRGPRAALESASNIAARADCTWWEVARATCRRALRPKAAWKEDRSLLRREVLLSGPERHPWLEGLPTALPGKKEHVEALVHIQHFLDRGAPCGIALLHPLMAQPLLELCLRIPSWMWVRGGRDRAIARDAFRDLLPGSVYRRRSKGSLEGLLHRAFARLAPDMRAILMTGELRRNRILDVDALDGAFAASEFGRDDLQLRISELVALELWMGCWRTSAGFANAV